MIRSKMVELLQEFIERERRHDAEMILEFLEANGMKPPEAPNQSMNQQPYIYYWETEPTHKRGQ